MNATSSLSAPPLAPLPANPWDHPQARRTVSWPAIFAGLVTAMALQVLFMMLGAGLGFAMYSPLTEDNPVANLGKGAVLIQGISAVLSLWLGGWVAGRFTPRGIRATGWLHGFGVWCAATVAGVLLVSAGAGWVLGDLAKVVGGGLSLAGQPAAAAVSGTVDLAKDELQRSGEALASFTDEAVGREGDETSPDANVRARREVGMAVARLFNPLQSADRETNRAAAVRALVQHTGRSEAEADRLVTEWTASFDQLKADLLAVRNAAEAKAREAAETAADALALFSLCAFASFLLGAVAASFGGNHGAACASRCELRTEGLPESA